MNKMLINMTIPFIEVEDCRDRNIHTFKIMNVEWVPEGVVQRKLRVLEAAKMATKCFLNNRIPFQYNIETKTPKQINVVKLKCVNQRFELGYKPKKDDSKLAAQIKGRQE
jgi:hypothetical protein